MAKLTLADTTSGYLSSALYNANNTLLEAALENTLSRDGTTPNTMSANLDMNSNKVVNVTDATNDQEAVTLAQLNAASIVASTIAATAVTIADAGGYYVSTTAEAALQEVWTVLASASNGDGASLIAVEDSAAHFAGADVEAVLAELQVNIDNLGTPLENVVEDTTPQLGGNLDANGNHINMADEVISRPEITDFGITSNSLTISANAATLDLSTGNAFELDLDAATGNVTITLSTPPASGTFGECIVKIIQDSTARTITWAGGTFVWPAGTQPTMTATNDAEDIFVFKTWDGGTTWYGNASQDYS